MEYNQELFLNCIFSINRKFPLSMFKQKNNVRLYKNLTLSVNMIIKELSDLPCEDLPASDTNLHIRLAIKAAVHISFLIFQQLLA